VYKELGPGYLESVYEDALCYELDLMNIAYQRQIELDVQYIRMLHLREGFEPIY